MHEQQPADERGQVAVVTGLPEIVPDLQVLAVEDLEGKPIYLF
jgi:hypothetical protein